MHRPVLYLQGCAEVNAQVVVSATLVSTPKSPKPTFDLTLYESIWLDIWERNDANGNKFHVFGTKPECESWARQCIHHLASTDTLQVFEAGSALAVIITSASIRLSLIFALALNSSTLCPKV